MRREAVMTRNFRFRFFLTLALLASAASGQSLDEVLARHAAAHGGLERWRAAEFASPLVDAAAKGNKVELLGKEELDGQPAIKLKVIRKDGAEETWYLDVSTFLALARFDRTLDLPDSEERWTYYSDFRAVDGLVIPHRQDQEYSIRHVSLTVEKVQINPEIDPGRFKLKPE